MESLVWSQSFNYAPLFPVCIMMIATDDYSTEYEKKMSFVNL